MQHSKLSAALSVLSLALLFATGNSMACSTMVVGKNVSSTGNILVGHNEDNDGRIITSQYWVPAADHAAGEMIEFEPDAAKIPQVPHTYGFYWSQTLHPAGYSYSDGFVNENGVVIASNQSYDTYDKNESVKEGGVGYGIRRLVAERARNARDGVDIAIALVTKYGYRAAGRVYTIADSKEAWQINLIRGGRYIAKKIGDNEVVYVSNAYTLGVVDVKAPDVLASPDLVEHAIAMGTYKPRKPGDYSDFNFREAYQTDVRRDAGWIKFRSQTAWKMLTGREIEYSKDFPYSITPEKKLSVDDVKKVMRAHYAHEDRSNGFIHQSINDIGNLGTFDSAVFELTPDKKFTMGWRTSGTPCENPYVPFYPLAKPSSAQAFMTPDEAARQQFHGKAESFSFRPDLDLFAYLTHQNLVDYLDHSDRLAKAIAVQEKAWDDARAQVESLARTIEKTGGAQKAMAFLHAFNANAYAEGTELVRASAKMLGRTGVIILADELKTSGDGTARLAILGSPSLDARKINPESLVITTGLPNEDIEIIKNPAKAISLDYEDVDGDGVIDAVATFSTRLATQYAVPGSLQEIYVFGKADGKKFAGFDVVKMAK